MIASANSAGLPPRDVTDRSEGDLVAKSVVSLGDRGFESGSLQRRVRLSGGLVGSKLVEQGVPQG